MSIHPYQTITGLLKPFASLASSQTLMLLSIPALLMVSACKESDSVTGPPPGEGVNEGPVNTGVIKHTLSTQKMDPVQTDELTRDMLGSYYDTVFGKSRAMIYTNFSIPGDGFSSEFVDNPANIDSIVLTLPYGGEEAYFGNRETVQNLEFYELQKRLFRENNYNSDEQFQVGNDPIGQWSGKLNPDNGEIRIKMEEKLEDIFSNASKENLTSPESFAGFFNGLYIEPQDDFINHNEGTIAYFELEQGANLKFYHNDSLRDSVVVNEESARVNTYESDISNANADTGANQQYAYIKPLAGLKAKMRFPDLEKWVADGLIAVHKAQVIIPANSYYHDAQNPPDVLRAQTTNQAGNVLTETSANYDEENQQYVFDIPFYFQDIFKAYSEGRQPNVGGLDISIPEDEPVLANPFLVRRNKNNSGMDSVKVEFTYSKVNEQ